jgi:hypothetical protein
MIVWGWIMTVHYITIYILGITDPSYDLKRNLKLIVSGLIFLDFAFTVYYILHSVKKAGFSYLLENINTTKGNLSFQLGKLKDADYIIIEKSTKGNYPLTLCQITERGVEAYEKYLLSIEEYFKISKR